MSHEKRQAEDIERDERWFAEVCERSVEVDTAPISGAVRVAVDEAWLAGRVEGSVPPGLAARTRQVVRETLAQTPVGIGNRQRPSVFRLAAWMGGGLAAAAVMGWLVVGLWNGPATRDSGDAVISFAAAFEEVPGDEELDQELAELRDAFSELDRNEQDWGEDLWDEGMNEDSESEDGA